MKSKSLSLLLSLMLAYSAHAGLFDPKTVEIELFDGSKIDFSKDVKKINVTSDSKLDYIELANGDNIYDSDIERIFVELKNKKKFEIPSNDESDNSTIDILKSIRVIGGDGSGGG